MQWCEDIEKGQLNVSAWAKVKSTNGSFDALRNWIGSCAARPRRRLNSAGPKCGLAKHHTWRCVVQRFLYSCSGNRGSATHDTSYNTKGIRKLFLMPSLAYRTMLVAANLQLVAANLHVAVQHFL
jgi:hypothetical protein